MVSKQVIKVREYCEGMDVELDTVQDRLIVRALNEAGFNSTEVDVLDLLEALNDKYPELMQVIKHDRLIQEIKLMLQPFEQKWLTDTDKAIENALHLVIRKIEKAFKE